MNRSSSSMTGKSKFKIVFLGDQNTGKSSIIERFINDKFNPESNPTIGIDFLGRNINYKNKYYRLQLWDTAGQQRYRSLIPSYLKDAVCAIYVFDLSNVESIENIERWIQMFKENKGPNTVSAICGNKLDLCRDFDKSKLDSILLRNKMPFYEVSACTGENIENMFFSIIQQVNELNQTRFKTLHKDPPAVQQSHTASNIDFDLPPITKDRLTLNDNDETGEIKKPPTKSGCCT